MSASFTEFRLTAAEAIADPRLQGALEGATARFRNAREKALAELPDVDLLRDHFKAVRAATLARLAEHLETFERNAAGYHPIARAVVRGRIERAST